MISKQELLDLYTIRKLSMKEIAQELETSVGSVNWWMKKHGIVKRSRSDANYEKYNKGGDPFKIVTINTIDQAKLFGLGIGLYWGEGNKVSAGSLRLGNTDPELIKVWLRFLKEICGVREDKITFGLQVFNDGDPDAALEYWLQELDVDKKQFFKTVSVIKPIGKGTYKRINKKGVLTVYVNNIKLVKWIREQVVINT